jgi:hypothetical protein
MGFLERLILAIARRALEWALVFANSVSKILILSTGHHQAFLVSEKLKKDY